MIGLYLAVAFTADAAVLVAACGLHLAPRHTADLLRQLTDHLDPQDDEPASTAP